MHAHREQRGVYQQMRRRTDVPKRRPTARCNSGLDFLSQDPINTFMDFFILIVGSIGSEGGAGAFRLVNSTQPQTGFDSVCVALKVTRKKEGQIKAGGGAAADRRQRRERLEQGNVTGRRRDITRGEKNQANIRNNI